MLELEVGIWSFEGCVSFLGFPRPVQRTDAFGFVFRTVSLQAKLLRSRVYKPGPWL